MHYDTSPVRFGSVDTIRNQPHKISSLQNKYKYIVINDKYMRIISISTVKFEPHLICTANDLSFVNYFQRSSVEELLNEVSIHAAESLAIPERKMFEHQDVLVLCQRVEGMAAVLVTDKEYPSRQGFVILQELLLHPNDKHMQKIITEYQHPHLVDNIARIQHQLDETLVIMHENIDLILQRGENLDVLLEKSERLSAASVQFYKAARKQNRCCQIQ